MILIGDRQVDPIEQVRRVVRWLQSLLTLGTDAVNGSKANRRWFLQLQVLNRGSRVTRSHISRFTSVAHR